MGGSLSGESGDLRGLGGSLRGERGDPRRSSSVQLFTQEGWSKYKILGQTVLLKLRVNVKANVNANVNVKVHVNVNVNGRPSGK